MGQPRRKRKKSTETLAHRVGKVELTLERIESQLRQNESCLEGWSQQAAQLEQSISNQLIDLQNRIREIKATGLNPDGLIQLEEGTAVNLEELERKMEEKCSLLVARERELQDLEKRMLAVLENLRAEIKEKDLLLTGREMEIKSFKQTLGSRVEELETLAKRQSGRESKATRLVSFLVDIGKKH